MGSGLSLFNNNPSSSSSSYPGLGDLPENCVSLIPQNLDPVEICRLSKLNKAFHGASWADSVWESKLPQDYKSIIEKICGPEKLQKRDTYNFNSRVIPLKMAQITLKDEGPYSSKVDQSQQE
ncbi:unnamed protein product [Cochlearia groenlandica]